MRSRAARQLLALTLGAPAAALAAAGAPVPSSPAAEAWSPPQAPGRPEGSFQVLTRAGQAPLPVLRLRWNPAEPGDYLIAGYRIYRATPTAQPQRRPDGGEALITALDAHDPVQIGQVYDYWVEAVDSRGLAGPRSQPGRMDLGSLEPALLAPPAPTGVSASSRRDDVALRWDGVQAWVAPISAYQVRRMDSPAGPAVGEWLRLTGTTLVDRPEAQGRTRWYAVASVDVDGRVSPWSATVSAQATGALPPGAPLNLSNRVSTERVMLTWEQGPSGTAPISGYLLRRREEGAEAWRQLAKLGVERRSYTDKAPGARGYLYSLAAFDAEGNTGPPAFTGASPSAKLLNKTLVVVMPTAYANHPHSDRGLNLNVLFDFYVGSLFESYTNPSTGHSRSGQFQPLQIGTVSTDTKWALLDDRGLIPGLAAGLYISALINFGQPTGAQTVGVSSAGGGIATLGNAYAVLSKRFWPGEPRASIHAGVMVGGLADSVAQAPVPKDWHLTARHLLPGGDLPSLLTRFVDPKLGARIAQAPHMAFGGLMFPFTVPLFFTEWRTGLRLELMAPLAIEAEYAPHASLPTPPFDPATQLPWMLNVHVDNLPLFGFEFGYFQYPGGFQLIAFYHIPDLTWSW